MFLSDVLFCLKNLTNTSGSISPRQFWSFNFVVFGLVLPLLFYFFMDSLDLITRNNFLTDLGKARILIFIFVLQIAIPYIIFVFIQHSMFRQCRRYINKSLILSVITSILWMALGIVWSLFVFRVYNKPVAVPLCVLILLFIILIYIVGSIPSKKQK